MQRSRKRLAVTLFLLFFTSSLFSQSDSSKIDTIKTVNVGIEQAGVIYDANGAIMKHVMTQNEFKKAACCTLSESFELSNTVEISNADGVSGIRQIEMMGLNGKYALLTRDNIPQMGSLALLNGLNNIPGPMVSDVRLAKGIGSVTLGYEGITGGIDYGLKTNENGPKLELNAYQNNQGRTEFNLFHKKSFKNNVHHFSYLHLGSQYITTDMNMDMYADMPLTNRIFAGNHLSFHKKKIEGQFGVSFWNEQKKNGQVSHTNTSELSKLPNTFKFNQNESKLDVFGKIGFILNEKKESSFGNIFNLSTHQNHTLLNSMIDRHYEGQEIKFSYSGLYQTNINKRLTIKSGISAMLNQLEERLMDSIGTNLTSTLSERQVGAFSEFVYKKDKLSVVLGIRGDYHNLFGAFVTPRIHTKYEFNKNNKLFFQFGVGRRTPYMFIENLPLFINNRKIVREYFPGNMPYGLPQERGINGGISFLKNFFFMDYPSTLTVDVFTTQFQNQVVIDRDQSLNQLIIASRNNVFSGSVKSIHVEWTIHPIRRMEMKFAYRYVQNLQFLNNQFQIAPFQSVHRGLWVVSYKTRNNWYFDEVTQINGPKRIAYFSQTDNQYSATFILANIQIRKVFVKGFECYVGVENIGNFKQNDPILSVHSSQNHLFDAGYSWAPANGRNYYFGIRYSLL